MNRRKFLYLLSFVSALSLFAKNGNTMGLFSKNKSTKMNNKFSYSLSDQEWKEKLTPEQYKVLRKAGTEPAFSSPYHNEKRKGVYFCAGCEHPLFSSEHKFDSGTGWPSFYQAINDSAIATSTDYKLIYPRTEEHCANCGGHLGHIFNDGPPPTGLRHCINGVALIFKPESL